MATEHIRTGRAARRPDAGSRRVAWAVTGLASAAMLAVPAGFAMLLSGGGPGGSEPQAAPATAEGDRRSKSDREARVTFHLREGALDMRILRGAPRRTKLVRGSEVRVMCGSTAGLTVERADWPRGDPTLRVELPARLFSAAEFCALKRGQRGIARVVFD